MPNLTMHRVMQWAARAAGLHFDPSRHDARGLWVVRPDTDRGQEDQILWNPVRDDAQNHQLQRQLKMTVAPEPSRGGWSAGAVLNGEFTWLGYHDDMNKAVVKAAAALGKAAEA